MKYKLGVVGDPIEHSLSPQIHNIFSKQTNINIEYQLYHVFETSLDTFIKDFFDEGGHGLNITLPHKSNCLRSVTNASSLVNLIGAANTLHSKHQDEIFADSTDGIGLVEDLKDKCLITSANVLILGAGGSASSIIPDLDACKPRNIIIDNRSKHNLDKLVQRFSSAKEINSSILTLESFNEEIDLIINATSMGFSGTFSWNKDFKTNHETVFYDLSYSKNDNQTSFLNWASQFSDKYFDGFGMLIQQAAAAFELWTGVLPETKIRKSDLLND
mgnify:FL=1|tara:strand:+ start:5567 stop:6385 length:819 start_codon:yes stop_codon:yes gene_type:complete